MEWTMLASGLVRVCNRKMNCLPLAHPQECSFDEQ
jgi:hypothetical protein